MAARRCRSCRHDWPLTLRHKLCPWCDGPTEYLAFATPAKPTTVDDLPAAEGEIAELRSEIAILELDAQFVAPHLTWVDMLERRHD